MVSAGLLSLASAGFPPAAGLFWVALLSVGLVSAFGSCGLDSILGSCFGSGLVPAFGSGFVSVALGSWGLVSVGLVYGALVSFVSPTFAPTGVTLELSAGLISAILGF